MAKDQNNVLYFDGKFPRQLYNNPIDRDDIHIYLPMMQFNNNMRYSDVVTCKVSLEPGNGLIAGEGRHRRLKREMVESIILSNHRTNTNAAS